MQEAVARAFIVRVTNADAEVHRYAVLEALRHVDVHRATGAPLLLCACTWLLGEFGDLLEASDGAAAAAAAGAAAAGALDLSGLDGLGAPAEPDPLAAEPPAEAEEAQAAGEGDDGEWQPKGGARACAVEVLSDLAAASRPAEVCCSRSFCVE